MRRIVAALALTTLVLAGCGGDDEPTAEADPTTTTTADDPGTDDTGTGTGDPGPVDPGPVDGCPYLDAAALDAALGTPFEERSASETSCTFGNADGLTVTVNRIDIAIDPEEYAEASTQSCDEGTVVEVDAGDFAYACIAIGPLGAVFVGDVLINLSVLSTDDEQAVADAFVEILPAVTVPG